jgi:hypothetical protein
MWMHVSGSLLGWISRGEAEISEDLMINVACFSF